jgi:hypothetical protein
VQGWLLANTEGENRSLVESREVLQPIEDE